MSAFHDRKSGRRGFTLLELLVVIGLIGLLIALMLPAVRHSGEAARRSDCRNKLKQLGIALHNYHDVSGHFPSAMGGTGGGTPLAGNAGRLSGLVALLPYLEQDALWQQISKPTTIEGTDYPAMGPAPWISGYDPWQTQIRMLLCPSASSSSKGAGITNYTFCIGDVAQDVHQPKVLRGAFGCGLVSRIDDITDGTSHTIALAEIGTPLQRMVVGQFAAHLSPGILQDPSLCLATLDQSHPTNYAKNVSLGSPGRGERWADGAAGYSLVSTILPPNSPSCAIGGTEAVDGVYSAGSYHPGGVQVGMLDGSTQFVATSIDAGDSTRPPPTPQQLQAGPLASPYGVWGALGTASGAEATQ